MIVDALVFEFHEFNRKKKKMETLGSYNYKYTPVLQVFLYLFSDIISSPLWCW